MASELSEDIEDYDLYHVDFTTASEWEVFIARVEEIIQEWKLNVRKTPPKITNLAAANWATFAENISFAEVDFTLSRHFVRAAESDIEGEITDDNDVVAEEVEIPRSASSCKWPPSLDEVMNPAHDFLPLDISGDETHPHVLAKWYGLTDFVVLTPIKTGITSESKLKVLLSSLCIAVNNTGCEVPMFVRSLEFWQKFYMGVCECNGVRSEFEMVHLKKVPPQCRYLTGLLSVFKSKIGPGLLQEPVRVAAKFCHILQEWGSQYSWAQEPPDCELGVNGDLASDLTIIPFGSVYEPICSLSLFTRWDETLESLAVDSETYSDFDPLTAPNWSLAIMKAENLACLLTDYITEFIILCMSNKTVEELLGDFTLRDSTSNMLQPFSVLTESRLPTLTSMLGGYSAGKHATEGPITNKLLLPIIYYLFPDNNSEKTHEYTLEEQQSDKVNTQKMKTCSVDSLVWRLAIIMAHGLHMLGGAKATAHLWHEFAQELRFRWSTNRLIPGVAPGFPDPKTCLLHQKLQMINCCIDRRIKRNEEAIISRDSDESEDEFFDCDEETVEPSRKSVDLSASGDGDSEELFKTARTVAPSGRLSQHSTLKLLKTGQPLYIPITQGDTPKTEDQLEEDAQILIRLGSDAEGSQLRAKLMSASLLSDMESFKAANPGTVIEDFIRWYSPRDWIEEEEVDEFGQKKGKLSTRMLLPGNTWLEVWSNAKGIPAKRQRRLFDETTEGEKALHFIESQDPANAAKLILPVLVHAALKRLIDESESLPLPNLQSAIPQMTKKLETLVRQPVVDMRKYQELCVDLGYAETLVTQVRSLEHKFSSCQDVSEEIIKRFACSLVSEIEVPVPGGPTGSLAATIKTMFVDAAKVNELSDTASEEMLTVPTNSLKESSNSSIGFGDSPTLQLPSPSHREFILRAICPRPSKHSTPCPHRLSAAITRHDITMAAIFSQDNTFF